MKIKRIYEEPAKGDSYKALGDHSIFFDYSMVYPHDAADGCDCRKPKIGGLKSFLKDRKDDIDFDNSLMIGDRDTDEEAFI